MYKRILVPVDGSETSNKALQSALQLARESAGRVRIIHAFDDIAFLSGYDYDGSALKAARDYANEVLKDAAEKAARLDVPAELQLLDAPGRRLGEVVAEEAASWQADLVVVGTHGRRGVSRALLGSGAEQVIRLAPAPVLVVRAAE